MKPLTGPMNQLNWTHKKGLNISEQPLSILASMLKASLNQIEQVSESSSHLRILPTNWHHKQPLSGTKANFIVTPDTGGCSVFRCGASLMRLPRSPGKESVTASPMAKPLARIGPPLLKALQPKLNWLIKARLSKVNLKVTSIKWHHTANCALVELEPRGQGTPVHDRYLPSRKGR